MATDIRIQLMKVVKSRAFKDRLKGHKESVIAMFSPFGSAGHMLYSISKDGSVRGWDLAERQITIKAMLDKKFKANEEREEEAAFDGEGREDKKEQESKPHSKDEIVAACFREHSVFGAFEDGSIVEWAFTNQGDILRQLQGHGGRVNSLAIVGESLLSGGSDSTLRVWQLATGECDAVYKTGGVVNLVRGQDKTVYALVSRNIFYEVDRSNNKVIRSLRFTKHSATHFFCLNNTLVVGTIDNKILVLDIAGLEGSAIAPAPKKVIEGVRGWVLSMELSGGLLYAGCDDRKIKIYNWEDMNEVEELGGHEDGVISLAFADSMLYSGSFDHSIRSWDIKEIQQRISERATLTAEDVESKKYEVYYSVVFKNKKKKLPAKKKK